MCVTVFHVSIVNHKDSRTEIGVGFDDRRAVLSADKVGGSLICFHGKALLIGKRMSSGNGINVIVLAITFGAEVTVTNKTAGFKFFDILWGNINMQFPFFICKYPGFIVVVRNYYIFRSAFGLLLCHTENAEK